MRVPYSIELLLDRILLELETASDELDLSTDELDDLSTEDDSETEELDGNFALELETTTEELDDLTTEEEWAAEELDCTFTLELETASDELNSLNDELEDVMTEDELLTSGSVPLFPLSPPHASKIRAAATIANNVIRCFRFICLLFLKLLQSPK
jgi:predicted  nucleic acid-binding Zn-ribbon protein